MISTSFNAQTVDEIIENYIENTGGSENWQNVKIIKMSASINQMGMEIPIEMVQSENKMYTKILIQGQEIKQGVFDGETLWSTNFMSMKAEKSDQEDVDNVKNELGEFPDPFLNYKEKGFSVELMGSETVDGSDTFKIKLTKNGQYRSIYLNDFYKGYKNLDKSSDEIVSTISFKLLTFSKL
jgi:hypothetical protein